MKKILFFLMVTIPVLLMTQCTENKDTKNTIPLTQKKDLSAELMILSDSVNSKWNKMMSADSIKFTDIKRLLEEISYCKKYDEKEFERLMKFRNEVYAQRYTQNNITDSLIDKYDSSTSLLINKVRNLKSKTPEILQHPLADQLENDIIKADNEDLIQYRKHYDEAGLNYNNFLDQNKEEIAKDSSLQSLNKKKKLFAVNS